MTKKKPDFLRDLDTAIMDELTGGGIKGNAAGLVGTLTQIKEIKQLCGLPFCGYMAKLETVRPSGVPDEVKAGVPDIMLPAARAGYHGLYIELKAGENTTTKKQKEWLEYLRQQGYYTAVCYGWQPAAQLIEQYLLHSDELTKEQETVTMR